MAISDAETDSPVFICATVNWDRPMDVPDRYHGTIDLLDGQTPPATLEIANRLLARLPELYDELRRIMDLVTAEND